MVSSNATPYFYTDKQLFGLDIGHGSVKVMQLGQGQKKSTIVGYGAAAFDLRAMDGGVIINPHPIADALHDLHRNGLIGTITGNRVAMALPAYRTFSRSIELPKLSADELREAVQLEVEQYVPVPTAELYLDYAITGETVDKCQLFVVAVRKKIVDSYLALTNAMGLEVVLIEPTVTACARYFARKDGHSDATTMIIDFGSRSADISIFDKTILAMSTAPAGGLVFTEAIRNKLHISQEKAGEIKTKHGLDVSKHQKDVAEALEPALQKMVTEIRRMLRYYEDRYGGKNHIGQVVMLGGGANMPGLGNYLTDALKMPVRTHNHPWALFEYDHLKPPAEADRLMYATVAGLSLLNPGEVFAQ